MFQQIRLASIVFSGLLVAACGGGGSSGTTTATGSSNPVTVAVPAPLTVSNGNPLTFLGQVSSTAGTISTMSWKLEALTLGANNVSVLANQDCKNTQKSPTGTEASCTLQVTPPTLLTADYTYKLTFTASDAKGNSNTASTTLLVLKEASSTYNPIAKVGSDITVTSGDKATMTCTGSGGTPATSGDPYAYQWVVSDDAGLGVKLVTTDTAVTSFTAPVVTASTTMKFQCRVTDDKQKIGTATQNVIVNPIIKPTVIPISYSGGVVTSGSNITLDGSKSVKYDANGKLIDGGVIYYYWTQKSGPVVDIFNAFSSVATTALPKQVSTRTAFVFTLNVSNSPITTGGVSIDPIKQVDVVFYVDPLPAISLVSYTPTQVALSGSAVVLKVDAPSNTGSNQVYYGWTQVSGPSVLIAGANTGNAGFVAPVVSTDTIMIFRASGGYQPITVTTPGTAAIDVIVLVQPIPTK
ncbi:hypothetical protein ACO0LB_02980 [Undibacterium sp. SXout7W]|uniref:hypothetical protein n=1 Tax=Undibacterium sp. SXout7W TaxID=3413049 RepID=UPI003BF2F503